MGNFRNPWIIFLAFISMFRFINFIRKRTKFIFVTVREILILGWHCYWNSQVEEFNGVTRQKRLRVLRFQRITVWEPLLYLTLESTDHDDQEVRLVWIIVWTLNIKLTERSLYTPCSCTCYWTKWTPSSIMELFWSLVWLLIGQTVLLSSRDNLSFCV